MHATAAKLDPGFDKAIFLVVKEDLGKSLDEQMSNNAGGVLFRVVVRAPPPSELTKTKHV